MSFIFISYSRKDQAYVSTLVQALTQRNLPVWLDNEINHGQAWNRVIREQLDQCQVFLLVMSPRAEQSPWVRNEMLYAINKRKAIFPLLLEGEHWFDVLSWQGADVTDGSLPLERFFEALRKYFPTPVDTADSLPVQTVMEERISPAPAAFSIDTKQPNSTNQEVELKSEKGIDYYALFQDSRKAGELKSEKGIDYYALLQDSRKAGELKSEKGVDYYALLQDSRKAGELKSEKGVNYTRLRDLLKAGEWKTADQETADQMLKAMGQTTWLKVKSNDLLNFPCADLKTIDQLWGKYSNGKWGFSVQKQIYVECGAKLDGQYPGNEIWREFCRRVGWRKGESYLNYSDLTFDLENSSSGEFPLLAAWSVGLGVSSLAFRLVNCSR
ncbi:MAG: GUN4 domain-containing protein [Cyanobacteria bacterium P01_F01_bin.56]